MASSSTSKPLLTTAASQLRLSATLEINELVLERRVQGQEIVHLGFGEATFPIHRSVAAAHRDASDLTSYLPVAGLKKLREVSHLPLSLAVELDSHVAGHCSLSDSSSGG